MPYRDVVSDLSRKPPVRYVNDCAVLYVRAVAYADIMNVAANHAVEPYARMLAYLHVAYDLRASFDERGRGDLRPVSFISPNHKLNSKLALSTETTRVCHEASHQVKKLTLAYPLQAGQVDTRKPLP